MLELGINRKNKVNLADYNFQKDIENRSLIASLSSFEYDVLQEIFFSSTKFSLKKFARSLEVKEKDLSPIFEKLKEIGLLSVERDLVLVDKELRKFFEFHMRRFEPGFQPDMEYLQGILRKVPIHILPTWYSIPRTSNNIFESIVEKYLLTPQLFQRYLSDLHFSNPLAEKVLSDVLSAPEFRVSSTDIITKYNLSRDEFEEILLTLEFSLVACATYTKEDDVWLEWITPFHEWREYLQTLKRTKVPSIDSNKEIQSFREDTFSFAKELGNLLEEKLSLETKTINKIAQKVGLPSGYVSYAIQKLQLLELVEEKAKSLHPTKLGKDFLEMTPEKKARFLYKHPLNKIQNPSLPQELATEKNLREVEKSLRYVASAGWVFFEDFLERAIICFNDPHSVYLKRMGKHWKYDIPSHSDEENLFTKLVIFEWLFEAGIVDKGECDEKSCFRVTPLGRCLFEE